MAVATQPSAFFLAPERFPALSPETPNLKDVSAVSSPTIMTVDYPRKAESFQLAALGFDEKTDWQFVPNEELPAFLEKYEGVFGTTLAGDITASQGIRGGGTMRNTLESLRQLRAGKEHSLEEVRLQVPTGDYVNERVSDDSQADLASLVNNRGHELINLLEEEGIIVERNVAEGSMFPVCLCLDDGSGRRCMALIEGCKSAGLAEVPIPKAEDVRPGVGLILVDAYELKEPDSSYVKAAKAQLSAREEAVLVIGLGNDSILSEPDLKDNFDALILHERTGGLGISGNKGEADQLVASYGLNGIEDLFLQTKLKFVLVTSGQQGASLFYRPYAQGEQSDFIKVEYALTVDQIYNGDTTGAGDRFLSFVLDGLMDIDQGSSEVGDPLLGDKLSRILEDASEGTLIYLEARGETMEFAGKEP